MDEILCILGRVAEKLVEAQRWTTGSSSLPKNPIPYLIRRRSIDLNQLYPRLFAGLKLNLCARYTG
jgi:hypothetical protein